ncbi:unnamed protein product [Mortierella alpina]
MSSQAVMSQNDRPWEDHHDISFSIMDARTLSELSKRLSIGYGVELSQDDISLGKEVCRVYSDVGDYVDFVGEYLNGDLLALYDVLNMKVENFLDDKYDEPIILNSLVLLALVTEDQRLKELTLKYLRNLNIPSITAILDNYFA